MKTWKFVGRVLPERYPVSVELPEQILTVPDFSLKLRSHLRIHMGQFINTVQIESGDVDIDTLRNIVETTIRTATDLIGYLRGISFDIEVISATSDDMSWKIFGIGIDTLASRRKSTPYAISGELFNAITENPEAHNIVLPDFREAIRNPIMTGFFCYRSIEGMMQSMKSNNLESDGIDWAKLRESLNIERDFIEIVKSKADDPRHGKLSSITDKERETVFTVTDEIIRRYIAFLTKGRSPLEKSEFPTLTAKDINILRNLDMAF